MAVRFHPRFLLLLSCPALLSAQQQQRPGQPTTMTIQQAFAEQAKPPLPRTHKPEPTAQGISVRDLMTRLYIYAADSMMGRETGTQGHVKATNYLAAELKKLGLKPAGDKGTFFQDLPVVARRLDPGRRSRPAGRRSLPARISSHPAPVRGRSESSSPGRSCTTALRLTARRRSRRRRRRAGSFSSAGRPVAAEERVRAAAAGARADEAAAVARVARSTVRLVR